MPPGWKTSKKWSSWFHSRITKHLHGLPWEIPFKSHQHLIKISFKTHSNPIKISLKSPQIPMKIPGIPMFFLWKCWKTQWPSSMVLWYPLGTPTVREMPSSRSTTGSYGQRGWILCLFFRTWPGKMMDSAGFNVDESWIIWKIWIFWWWIMDNCLGFFMMNHGEFGIFDDRLAYSLEFQQENSASYLQIWF